MFSAKSYGSIAMYSGEFSDRSLEKEYFSHDIRNGIKYISPILFLLGVIYLLFIIPDFYLIKNPLTFELILINRVILLAISVFLFFFVKKLRNYHIFANIITVYEFILSISFLIIFGIYESPDFYIQAFGVVIIILGIFLIPNRWIYMVALSLSLSAGFFAVTAISFENVDKSDLSAALVYLVLVIAISSVSTYRINYYKRKQYLGEEEMVKLLTTDPLTGLYNRYKFDQEFEKWIKTSKMDKNQLSLAIFDLDDFKMINDSFGHLAGDRVIVQIAALAQEIIGEPSVLARWGGEEFVALLPGMGMEDAVVLLEKLKGKIIHHNFGNIGRITCSFGVAAISDADDSETFLHKVDKLLYIAKASGKNMVISPLNAENSAVC